MIRHGIGSGRRLSRDGRHLVLVCLFVSSDLSLQVLDVTVEGAHEPQQALPLQLQAVDVGASVVQLSLQAVQLDTKQKLASNTQVLHSSLSVPLGLVSSTRNMEPQERERKT